MLSHTQHSPLLNVGLQPPEPPAIVVPAPLLVPVAPLLVPVAPPSFGSRARGSLSQHLCFYLTGVSHSVDQSQLLPDQQLEPLVLART